jgi:hypothetical protein
MCHNPYWNLEGDSDLPSEIITGDETPRKGRKSFVRYEKMVIFIEDVQSCAL